MTEEPVCIDVDIAKSTMDVAASNLEGTQQFENDHKGITINPLLVNWVRSLTMTMGVFSFL